MNSEASDQENTNQQDSPRVTASGASINDSSDLSKTYSSWNVKRKAPSAIWSSSQNIKKIGSTQGNLGPT